MTHHFAEQQHRRVISAKYLVGTNTGTPRVLVSLLLMDTSAVHSSLCQMLTWHHMEVCHKNSSAVSHVQDQNLLNMREKKPFCCDECSSDCVWRERSRGLSSVSLVKKMMELALKEFHHLHPETFLVFFVLLASIILIGCDNIYSCHLIKKISLINFVFLPNWSGVNIYWT